MKVAMVVAALLGICRLSMGGETVAVPGEVVECHECHGEKTLRRHLSESSFSKMAGRSFLGYRSILRLDSNELPWIRCVCPGCGGMGKKIKVANTFVKMPPNADVERLHQECAIEEAKARVELLKMALDHVQRDLDQAKKDLEAASPQPTPKNKLESPAGAQSEVTSSPRNEQSKTLVKCPQCGGTGRGGKYSKCLACAGSSKEICPTCKGDWRIKCSGCDGKGKVWSSGFGGAWIGCPKCQGRGLYRCPDCDAGRVSCKACKGIGQVELPCPHCKGLGKIEAPDPDNF